MTTFTYNASGKLLLFGEYLVLRGARCLAIPLALGQTLRLYPIQEQGIVWRCFEREELWLEVVFSESLEVLQTSDIVMAARIQELLKLVNRYNPDIPLSKWYFKFDLNFDRQFGLGTSSTLISLLSQWSGVDPYLLSMRSFGGSAYDVAAATAEKPFLYSLGRRYIKDVVLPQDITDHLLFIYMGQKRDSAAAVEAFDQIPTNYFQLEKMDNIVQFATQCRQIGEWGEMMLESEQLLSDILGEQCVQDKYFKDYPYEIKSLGAWGGDFVMATCRDINEAKAYFEQKQYKTVFTYNELIKK
ncbi:MAG TPA: GYDIA family GHMP kinase [Edaphocola sp.]|nr:GYDIA family GHMP kinase [Edaphocola sp.]